MARLVTDGAESGDLLRGNITGGVSVTSAAKRSGTYAYQITGTLGNGRSAFTYPPFASPVTEFYARFAVRPTGNTVATRWFAWYNGASEAGSLRIPANVLGVETAQVQVYDGTTLRDSSSFFTWQTNEWHVLEVRVKIDANPDGIIQVKFDGVMILNFAGATNAQAQVDRFALENWNGAAAAQFDDIAFNDTSGGADNSWAGDGGVLAALVPTGAGNYSDFTANTGEPFAAVDEIPHNSATDYILSSTIDEKSTFAMSNLGALPDGASIARVWCELVAQESAAEGGEIATLIRSGTVDTQGSDQVLTVAWARYLSAELLTDPNTAAAWTTGGVDALEAGAVAR